MRPVVKHDDRSSTTRVALIALAFASSGAVLWLGLASGRGAAAQEVERPRGSARDPSGQTAQQEEYEDPTRYPEYVRSGPHLPGYAFTELPLDPDSPFYPSSASTRSGGLYSQAQLMDVERCGDAGCHPDIYGMWYESTHHLASMNDPWYRRTFEFIAERSGVQTARWCGGCHDPALMMTGEMSGETAIDFDSAAASIGISCQFCHSVSQVDPAHANGSYELAPAAALPNAGTDDPELRAEGNRQLLADEDLVRRHKSRRRSFFHGLSLFCGTCHKQSLITPVNNYKWFRGFDEFDGWQDSGISGASARSFYYPERSMQCQDCHMPEVPSDDAGNDDGYVNSHRFPGANTALSAFHGYDAQLRETVRFLQDDKLRVEVFAVLLPASPGTGTDAIVAPASAHEIEVEAGTEIGVDVVVRTAGVGHSFTGGTTDSNLSWLEIMLLDDQGAPLAMSGGMDSGRAVDEDAHAYRGLFLDEAGQELFKRNGWDRRTPVYVNAIPPGAADTVHYRFTVPAEATDMLRLRARLNYRKHRQAYNRWAMGAEPAISQPEGVVSLPGVDTRAWTYDDSRVPELPTVVLAEDSITLRVRPAGMTEAMVNGESVASDVLVIEPSNRTRFNDYAIGLLRQSDLRGAIRFFELVQQMDPGYADGFVNEARAHLQEGNLEEAEATLEQALEVEPGFVKAAYFQSQVARGFGEYDRAVELLQRVVEAYPFDRVARLDLGNTLYLLRRYEEAIDHFLFVIDAIDPEELGAHYNLMLTYRALGESGKAAIHESRYRRYKEDEDIRQLSGPYRRDHPSANNEAQPIHVHRLASPNGRFSAADRFPYTEFLEGGRYHRQPTVFPGPLAPWLRSDTESPSRR